MTTSPDWQPEAEWEFVCLYLPEMEVLKVKELFAPNEALATLFGFRYLRDQGYNPDSLRKIKVERVN